MRGAVPPNSVTGEKAYYDPKTRLFDADRKVLIEQYTLRAEYEHEVCLSRSAGAITDRNCDPESFGNLTRLNELGLGGIQLTALHRLLRFL